MTDPTLTLIASRAEQAAIEQLMTGVVRPNQFAGTAHEAQYAAALARYLLLHSTGETSA